MSICAGCGMDFGSYVNSFKHQCSSSGANISDTGYPLLFNDKPPPYITDILERLTRIEELLREEKK